MKRPTIRHLIHSLIVAALLAFAVYKLKFAPVMVTAHTVTRGELVVTHDHRTLDLFDRILDVEDRKIQIRERKS